ncbi:MAG TPA: outer membrane lipoprotein carrier protein LolA [Vicinamibacteria bacterium]|nr:outer membrane lipoprotein carrier protein LolA [Vicinamibacteria bacterium]
MLSFLLAAAVSAAPVQDRLSEIVERIERHYDATADFEASFTQRYERRLLRRTVEEKGSVSVKKPGRMRWEYRSPEEKLFVTDGTKTYFYLPSENQVMVSHQPQGAMGMEPGSPFELLAGRGRLSDSFTASFSEEPPAKGGIVLRLDPKTPREEFEVVELEIDPKDGRVLRVVLIDTASNRTEFLFDDVRENVGLSETLFRFAIPSGVEVVVQPSDNPNGAP